MTAEPQDNIGPDARQRGCPPPEHLAALAGDALPDEVRREVSAHLARCAACRALAADLGDLDEADAPKTLDARVVTSGGRGRIALLVAAAVLAAIGLSAWWRAHEPKMVIDTAESLGLATEPSPGRAPTPRWTIEKPALVLPAATVLVMRGSDPKATALATALEPYRTGDFKAAETRLTAFTRAYPDSADGWFYLGASRLLIDADNDGRRALDRAADLGASASHPEMEWLRATAEARTGATDSAKARLSALCDAKGQFEARACAALKMLR